MRNHTAIQLDKRVIVIPLIIVLSVLLGYFTAIRESISLVLVIGALMMFFVIIKPRFVFYSTLVLLFSIPAGSYDFFLLKIPIIQLDITTLLLWLLVIIYLFRCMTEKKAIILPSAKFMIMITLLVIYTIVCYEQSLVYYFNDIKIFSTYIVYLLMFFFWEGKTMVSFIKVTVISSVILSLIVILMFYTKTTLFHDFYANTYWANDTRATVSNQSNFIIAMPLLIVALKEKILQTKWRFFIIISLILMGISLILGESRTLIFCVAVSCLITQIFTGSKSYLKNVMKLVYGLLIVVVVSYIYVLVLPVPQKISTVYQRFEEVVESNGQNNSLTTRQNSINYAMKEIIDNPLGKGIGAPMQWVDNRGNLIQLQTNIDNGFITFLYKFGWSGLIIWIIFYFLGFLQAIKLVNKSNHYYALAFLISLPLVILNDMLLTAQLAMNSAIFSYILVILAIFEKEIRSRKLKFISSEVSI
ncbi:O-antigen ligase family protein [Paenibacillus solisilvae]|uniref:O-antigen ligase family protein n=1 Tax=Paenibacillus solisilvae TaxID=2486751 RepID=A0ABW0VVE6_9BACL